ncbi:ZP domain-containing protein [Trichonephila clavipes]|nr:ZP domain-containing protein [Trichonephila clavipes]
MFIKETVMPSTPPVCDATGHNVRRRRRKRQSDSELQDKGSLEKLRLQDEDLRDKSVEVYGGLYVNEVDEDEEPEASSSLSSRSDDEFCVSTRKFAIGIAIAGVLLMLAVILLVACIVHRRRRRKGTSTTGSSIYSGPYSNHAYSRD